jgi:hypothetical protein
VPPATTPTPGASFAAPQLQARSAARVIVAELNIRQEPTVAAAIRRVVKRGAIFVLSGFAPIQADGYSWWFTEEIVAVEGDLPPLPTRPGRVDGGYVAVASADRAYVRVLPPRCPTTVDVATIAGMLDAERLACFGDRSVTMTGLYGCWICGDFDVIVYEPEWLAHPALHALWRGAYREMAPVYLHFPEALQPPEPGSIIEVTGHFDDPRSVGCRILTGETGLPPVPHADAETWCRQHFVVDHFHVMGIDPAFPPNG